MFILLLDDQSSPTSHDLSPFTFGLFKINPPYLIWTNHSIKTSCFQTLFCVLFVAPKWYLMTYSNPFWLYERS